MKTIPRLVPLVATVSILMAAQLRAQSVFDGFDPNVDGTVRVAVVQPDGKILIGGLFNTVLGVPRTNIARLNPDGTLDAAFNPNAGPNPVLAIALQADGKVLVGGDFTSAGGQPRNNIARLDPVTGLADAFNPNANNVVYGITVQPGGKILVSGLFNGANSIGGQARNRIARLDPTTGAADSFNPNADAFVETMVFQADGKVIVGGGFSVIGGQARKNLARLDPNTGLADSFNPSPNGAVHSIAIQADGRILVGGEFTGANSIGGQARNRIARLDAGTGLADSFDPNASHIVFSVRLQPDGKILVGGFFTGANSIGGQTRNCIARLDPTSGLADSFNPDATGAPFGTVYSIAVQQDGKIVAGGDFTTLAPNGGAAVTRNHLARLHVDGRVDQTLNNLGTAGNQIQASAVQPDGKILIGGSFSTVLGVPRNNIARLNTDGTLDTSFDPKANASVLSIAVQPDGRILAGGNFNGANSIGGQTRNRIARLDPITGAADSFNPNASGAVSCITVQPDGKILATGVFGSIGGQTRRIGRLDPITVAADSFNPNPDSDTYSIAVQTDGKIVVGGIFSVIGGQPRNDGARLDPNTGLADPFNPGTNGDVQTIAVQPDGRILVGGSFGGANSIGGQTRNGIARLNSDGSVETDFNPNAGAKVNSIVAQSDGNVIAGGFFNNVGGQARNFIARLDAITGAADSFNPNAGNNVWSVVIEADGKILVGGLFSSMGGQSRSGFARLSNNTAALQNLTVTPTTVTWTRGGSSPQLTRATFESSTDNVTYTPLGNGTATGSNWTLTGLSLPTGQNFYVRARGYYRSSGFLGSSESITESVRNAFFPGAAPVITSPLTASATVGQPFTYQFEATGADSLLATNLPTGLTFNTSLGAITGIPTTAGTFSVGLTASNLSGVTNATLTITVQPPPTLVIASSTAATGRVGQSFRFQVYTIGATAAARVSASGLPSGLSIDPVTGVISGTPTVAGSSAVTLTVTDGATTTNSILELTFTSDPALPVIAGSDTVLLTPGQFVTYVINAPSNADPSDRTVYTLIGTLPAGLGFDPNTGTISGTYAGVMESRHGNRPDAPDLSGGALLGSVQLFATNSHGTSTFQLLFLASPSGAVNISTRLLVGTGENVLIGGFIVTGDAPKVVIARAIGPSTGVPGALQDPVLELHDSAGHVVVNDNWKDTQKDLIVASTVPPIDDRESAIVIGLDPGNYTAIVSGKDGGTGIALAEIYDLGTASLATSASAKLANISTRGFVLTGNDVMIGGFIVQRTSTKVIMRAIGPSLSQSGVQGTLQDPVLELRDGSGSLIVSNDDWRSTQEQQIIDTTVPPRDDRESAIVATLIPGNYTAIVQGKNNSTGVALVEVYQLQ